MRLPKRARTRKEGPSGGWCWPCSSRTWPWTMEHRSTNDWAQPSRGCTRQAVVRSISSPATRGKSSFCRFSLRSVFSLLGFLWLELGTSGSRAILVGAISLLALAVGLDFIEGLDADHPWNAYTWAADHFDIEPWTRSRFGRSAFETLRHFSKSVEETMEMAAHSFLWFLVLRHLRSCPKSSWCDSTARIRSDVSRALSPRWSRLLPV